MKLLLTLCFTLFISHASQLPKTQQLLVVTTENWASPKGILQRYEKADHTWKKIGNAIIFIRKVFFCNRFFIF